MLFSILVSFTVPCEPVLYRGQQFDVVFIKNMFYQVFRLLMNFSDFSGDSYSRLSVIHVSFVICVVLFFINFMIALLSDHVSAISSNLEYHFQMQRLKVAYQIMSMMSVFKRLCGGKICLIGKKVLAESSRRHVIVINKRMDVSV